MRQESLCNAEEVAASIIDQVNNFLS